MEILQLESLIFEASKLFLWPVMLLILCSLAYSLIALGYFIAEAMLRSINRYSSNL